MSYGDLIRSRRSSYRSPDSPPPPKTRGLCCKYSKFEGFWRVQEYEVPGPWPWSRPIKKQKWMFWGLYEEDCVPGAGSGETLLYCPPRDEDCDKVTRYPKHDRKKGAHGRICYSTQSSAVYDPESQTCSCSKRTPTYDYSDQYFEGGNIREACTSLMDALGPLCECPS